METNAHDSSLHLFDRLNRWIQESIMVKLVSIGFLVLVLLIPSAWIQSIIQERQGRAEEVMQEVSAKWSGQQALSGPILVIPYRAQEKIDRGKEGIEIREYVEKYFFLPETLDVTGEINPQVLHRGIFDAAVYASTIDVNANFGKPDFLALGIPDERVLWSEARMVCSITDLRGIKDNPDFTVGTRAISTEPSSNVGVSLRRAIHGANDPYVAAAQGSDNAANGIVADLGWRSGQDFAGAIHIRLNLNGSQMLSFVPAGRTTTVKMSGPWNNPNFDGEFLPERREISEKSFSATWKILHYNRPFPQQWFGSTERLDGSEFGVRLLIPVDQYQKSMRTSKYGVLVIILTFMALFLVEITRRIRIHPFQYILVGAALIVYYTLLLSLSEQFGYNAAYWIATAATVGLISFYAVSFLKTRSLVMLFASLMVIFYSFIFIIILQQDFSLLLGSVGMFLMVGALMYFSRKVKWYEEAA